MEVQVTPLVKVRAVILDPFGSVIAEGELHIPHLPDEHTPSTADVVRAHLTGTRSVLKVPGYDGPAYSLRITNEA